MTMPHKEAVAALVDERTPGGDPARRRQLRGERRRPAGRPQHRRRRLRRRAARRRSGSSRGSPGGAGRRRRRGPGRRRWRSGRPAPPRWRWWTARRRRAEVAAALGRGGRPGRQRRRRRRGRPRGQRHPGRDGSTTRLPIDPAALHRGPGRGRHRLPARDHARCSRLRRQAGRWRSTAWACSSTRRPMRFACGQTLEPPLEAMLAGTLAQLD